MITLRDYQSDFNDAIRQAFRSGATRVLGVGPCAMGKTACFCRMIHGAMEKGNRVMILLHRNELVEQTMKALRLEEVAHGVIAQGYAVNQFHKVQVASTWTLARRLDKIIPPDLIVVDESHRIASATYTKILAAYSTARVIGVTATPERLDGKGLGQIFSHMIRGPEMSWLIQEGYLSKPKYLSVPVGFDDTGLKVRFGEFKPEDTEIMEKPQIVGDIVQHYRKYADGLSAIAFCRSVKHAEHLAECFRTAGYPAESLDGQMTRNVRKDRVSGLRDGSIKILTTCDLVSEGFDLPAVGCGILARPTASLVIFIQQVGRVLRPIYAAGADLTTRAGRLAGQAMGAKPRAIILDHAANVRRHGLAEDFRDWSLDGAEERKRKQKQEPKLSVRQCPSCYLVHAPAFECPGCGWDYKQGMELPKAVAGELIALGERDAEFQRCVKCGKIHAIACERCPSCGFDERAIKERQEHWNRVRERSDCETVGQLAALGRKRGIKNPGAWASHVMAARLRKAKVAV